MNVTRRLVIAAGALILAASAARASDAKSITFFVASDSHFGAVGMEAMNRLPGTEYPAAIGGRVDVPRGVLFTGDTTDNGLLDEFALFEKVYGRTGRDGLLNFPVFETIGNHDVNSDSPIKKKLKQRHGGVDYSWDWEDVHFVCLDMYPDAATLAWLARDLEKLDAAHALVLYFHYSLEGRYSGFWSQAEKDAFAAAISGRNVLAIFHGHEHRVGRYEWNGHPVFRPGAPRHSSHAFLAARFTSTELAVAAWDFDNSQWLDAWIVPVRRTPPASLTTGTALRR